MSEIKAIKIELIDACDDSRVVDPAHVQAIVDDMAVGDTPGASPIDVIQRGKRYQQVFGQHRLAAYIQAGKTEIQARIFQPEDFAHAADIKLHQVKENLFQRSLSALDKALAINDWKEAYDEKFPTYKHGGRRIKADEDFQVDKIATCFEPYDENSSSQNGNLKSERFSKTAAEAIGVGKNSIYRSLKIAQAINLDYVSKISLHPLANKQGELLSLVEHEPEKQAQVLDLILDEESEVETVAEAVAIAVDRLPKTKKTEPYVKIYNSFARLKKRDQYSFFELNAEAIKQWIAEKK